MVKISDYKAGGPPGSIPDGGRTCMHTTILKCIVKALRSLSLGQLTPMS